jgi:hypothetical protein
VENQERTRRNASLPPEKMSIWSIKCNMLVSWKKFYRYIIDINCESMKWTYSVKMSAEKNKKWNKKLTTKRNLGICPSIHTYIMKPRQNSHLV